MSEPFCGFVQLPLKEYALKIDNASDNIERNMASGIR